MTPSAERKNVGTPPHPAAPSSRHCREGAGALGVWELTAISVLASPSWCQSRECSQLYGCGGAHSELSPTFSWQEPLVGKGTGALAVMQLPANGVPATGIRRHHSEWDGSTCCGTTGENSHLHHFYISVGNGVEALATEGLWGSS